MGLTGTVTNEMVTTLAGLDSVEYLRLAENDMSPWDAPQFTRFVKQRCAALGSRCSGLPYAGSGFSCTAFGFMARVKLDEANECDKCDGDQTGTIFLILLMVALMVIGLTTYVIIILKYPEALRRWVSFAIILVNHTQTLSILGSLNLTWPPIVKMILSALTLFQVQSASCLLPPNVPSFWVYAFMVLSFSLLTLGLVTLAMTFYDGHGKSDAADRLEFALTVLFSTLFVYSLQVCSVVLRENLTATESHLARIAGALAAPVLLLICALVYRFWHKVAAYRRAIDGRGWNEGGWCTSRGSRVYPRSLRQRVFYLTHRFGMHAQRWQFIVWARQLALIILIGMNEVIAYNHPVQVKYTRYVSAGVAVVIILVALRWHVKVAPYAYKTQNALESFLMICNILLLTTVCVYQTLADIERGLFLSAPEATVNVSEYQQSALVAELRADDVDSLVEPPFMGHDLPIFVATEVLMVVFLGLSFLSTALYVVYDVRAKRRAVEGTDPTLVLTAAEMYFDAPIRAALLDGRLRLVSCDWMLSAMGGGALTSILAPQGSGWPLPDEAYMSPEAAAKLLARGDRSIFMLSYAWETLLSPDPHLRTLHTVRAYLRRQDSSGCGLYWDVFSQRGVNWQKTVVDDVVSDTDLAQLLCASVTGTVVCCVKRPAVQLPHDLQGHLLLYDYAQHVSDKALMIARKQIEVEEDEVATFSEAEKSAPERTRREVRPSAMPDAGSALVSMPLPPPVNHAATPVEVTAPEATMKVAEPPPPEVPANKPIPIAKVEADGVAPFLEAEKSAPERIRREARPDVMPGVVESVVVQQLQAEIAALRDENQSIGRELHEIEQASLNKIAALRDENARLRRESVELKAEAAMLATEALPPPTNPVPAPEAAPVLESTEPTADDRRSLGILYYEVDVDELSPEDFGIDVDNVPLEELPLATIMPQDQLPLQPPPSVSPTFSPSPSPRLNSILRVQPMGSTPKASLPSVDLRKEATLPPPTPPPSPPSSRAPKRFGLDSIKTARRGNKAAAHKEERAEAGAKRATERAVEEVLRTKLHDYGRVISCTLVGAHAHVRFDSHAIALKAVTDPELACDLVHLDKPFDERGRCIAEEGIARVAIAHLRKAEEVGQLPSRFILAQARRPKLVYVGDDGDAQECEVDHSPDMALSKMCRELEAKSAHFRGKDEREDVLMGVAQMEYLIDRSMDEATQLQQLDRFTISPALVEQLRLTSSIEVRARPGTCPVICIRSPCKSGALITFSGGFEGLNVGAVIVAVNGAVVSGQASVVKHVLAQCAKSGAAELTLARRSWREKIDRGTDDKGLGVSLCASPRGIGALVCKVRPGSLAEKHDVRQGDTILSVNDSIGESPEQVLALVQRDQVVELVLERFTKDISFLKAHLEESATDGHGDVEAAAGLDDDVITLEGVAKHRLKHSSKMQKSTNPAVIKRASFLFQAQVGNEVSCMCTTELQNKQLTVHTLATLVRWMLMFLKEKQEPWPFTALAPYDATSINNLVTRPDQSHRIRVFVDDSTEVTDLNVHPIALVKSQYKPVRITIQILTDAQRRAAAVTQGAVDPQKFNSVVPNGCVPGSTFIAQTPSGQRMMVKVPAGAKEGTTIEVALSGEAGAAERGVPPRPQMQAPGSETLREEQQLQQAIAESQQMTELQQAMAESQQMTELQQAMAESQQMSELQQVIAESQQMTQSQKFNRVKELKDLLNMGVLTQHDFEAQKKMILEGTPLTAAVRGTPPALSSQPPPPSHTLASSSTPMVLNQAQAEIMASPAGPMQLTINMTRRTNPDGSYGSIGMRLVHNKVTKISEGTAAADSMIKVGDTVISCDGHALGDLNLSALITQHGLIGPAHVVVVKRDAAELASAPPGPAPPAPAMEASFWKGASVLASRSDGSETRGVIEKVDASRGMYYVCFGSGIKRKVPGDRLRLDPDGDAGAPLGSLAAPSASPVLQPASPAPKPESTLREEQQLQQAMAESQAMAREEAELLRAIAASEDSTTQLV